MENFLHQFHATLDNAKERLEKISDEVAAIKPSPEKWSIKEILGHLVDSSINNHKRFVEGQWKEDLVFPGYNQDNWVAIQHYNELSWFFLINIWYIQNQHLVYIIAKIPNEILKKKHSTHNFQDISWEVPSPDEPGTLEYLVRDYYGHLCHHLDQIWDLERMNSK